MRTSDRRKVQHFSLKQRTRSSRSSPMKWSYCSRTATRRRSWKRMNVATWPLVRSISKTRSSFSSISTIAKLNQPFLQLKSCFMRFKFRSNRGFNQWLLAISIITNSHSKLSTTVCSSRIISRIRDRLSSTIRSLSRSSCLLRKLREVNSRGKVRLILLLLPTSTRTKALNFQLNLAAVLQLIILSHLVPLLPKIMHRAFNNNSQWTFLSLKMQAKWIKRWTRQHLGRSNWANSNRC